MLAQPHDRAVVDESLVGERRVELRRGLFLRLAGDRAEEADLVLLEQLDGSVRQGITFLFPELPTDVGLDPVGLEPRRFEKSY